MRSTTTPLTTRDQRFALRLLRQAVSAIADELHAAGPDDVREHPQLSEHASIHDRVWRFLDRVEAGR
jgi:hypothetical protein